MTVKEFKSPPDPDVVDMLEQWLAAARSGELQTVLIFAEVSGGRLREGSAGSPDIGSMLFAFEMWKFHQTHHAAERERPVPNTTDDE